MPGGAERLMHAPGAVATARACEPVGDRGGQGGIRGNELQCRAALGGVIIREDTAYERDRILRAMSGNHGVPVVHRGSLATYAGAFCVVPVPTRPCHQRPGSKGTPRGSRDRRFSQLNDCLRREVGYCNQNGAEVCPTGHPWRKHREGNARAPAESGRLSPP